MLQWAMPANLMPQKCEQTWEKASSASEQKRNDVWIRQSPAEREMWRNGKRQSVSVEHERGRRAKPTQLAGRDQRLPSAQRAHRREQKRFGTAPQKASRPKKSRTRSNRGNRLGRRSGSSDSSLNWDRNGQHPARQWTLLRWYKANKGVHLSRTNVPPMASRTPTRGRTTETPNAAAF